MNPKTDMPQELARFLEHVLDGALPGCRLFCRGAGAPSACCRSGRRTRGADPLNYPADFRSVIF